MNIALSTLFSKIIGPRRQGTIQGIFQMSGSSGRMMAPLIIRPTPKVAITNQTSSMMFLVVFGSLIALTLSQTCRTPPLRTKPICADKKNPLTGDSDCPRMTNFCQNSAYRSLMEMECPKTCGYCR
uniref:ShKT domain-containing protein n=1 Tax=Heterorhabditis bacteriophora TaxID=37862 RepID=A0A1I7X3P3_HETBA